MLYQPPTALSKNNMDQPIKTSMTAMVIDSIAGRVNLGTEPEGRQMAVPSPYSKERVESLLKTGG